MRKINSYFEDVPLDLIDAVNKLDFPNQSDEVKSAIYGKAKPKLMEIYRHKCAYCEIDIAGGAPYHVEHYRPKGNKNHKNDYPDFTGYFWLGYEWTNFLLVCPYCNTKKSDTFPLKLEGKRVKQPPEDINGTVIFNIEDSLYKDEDPLLLHPVLDGNEIGKHIYFKQNGEIESLSDKGKKSIECYGLNRNYLTIKRAELITESIQKQIIYEYLRKRKPLSIDEIDDELEKIISKLKNDIKFEKETFIAFRATILNNFSEFVIKNKVILKAGEKEIEIPQKDLWLKCVEEKLNKHLKKD